jgi:hypothetical protein
MEIIGQADDDDIGIRVVHGLGHAGRPFRDSPLAGEGLGFVVGQGADGADAVTAPLSLDRHRIECADEPGSEQSDVMRFGHIPSS